MISSIIFQKRYIRALEESDLLYDPDTQVNMVRTANGLGIAIEQPMVLPTNSKTMQAPGDDDPDRDNEYLY